MSIGIASGKQSSGKAKRFAQNTTSLLNLLQLPGIYLVFERAAGGALLLGDEINPSPVGEGGGSVSDCSFYLFLCYIFYYQKFIMYVL